MKKLGFILFILSLLFLNSSCHSQRRGVQFYSGDKNAEVIENQLSLTQEKRSEYEIQLRRLRNERSNIISQKEGEMFSEISRLENENKRLEQSLNQLKRGPQRLDGDHLLEKIERLENKISQNNRRLESLYNSDSYPKEAARIDRQISQTEAFLFELQLAEDQKLVRMSGKDELNFFQGNIRNGYEAANSYMLMKWAQESTTGRAVNNNSNDSKLSGIIVNEFHRGVTAVIRHESGFQFPDIPISPKSTVEIELPLPGKYICYFKRGNRQTNTVIKKVNPMFLVNYKGADYGFVLIQRGY